MLWSSVLRIIEERNRLFVFGTLLSCLIVKSLMPELIERERRMNGLGKVGTDALLVVLF